MLPSWWADGVRVVHRTAGQHGRIFRAGKEGWLVQLDDGTEEGHYAVSPEPDNWVPEVRQLLTPFQRDRIVHDAERALLRAFGCHYVPEFEGLPERLRGVSPHPRAVGRDELDGLQNIIRGAVTAALAPYTTPS